MTRYASPALRATVLQALADALEDQYPGIVAVPLKPGQKPRPGARVLPAVRTDGAVLEADGEPVGDVGVPRPVLRRRNHNGVDQ